MHSGLKYGITRTRECVIGGEQACGRHKQFDTFTKTLCSTAQ